MLSRKILSTIMVIFFYICVQIRTIEPLEINENSFTQLSLRDLDLSHITNSMRTENIDKISSLQRTIINFTQETLNSNKKTIKSKIRKYLKKLRKNVTKLNLNFNKEYQYCKHHLGLYKTGCHKKNMKTKCDIKYNRNYIKSLKRLDSKVDRTVVKFYNSNILSTMKTLTETCENSSIIASLKKLMCKLESHFHINNRSNVKEDKFDSFLEKMLIKVDHHIVTIHKQKNNNDEENDNYVKDRFLKERGEVAEILYEKAQSYMNRAVKRKKELNIYEDNILLSMQHNDNKVTGYISELNNLRKENNDLVGLLKVDNKKTKNILKKCEVLSNISTKCKEMAKIYQSVLNSYEEQSDSLERIFNVIKNTE